MNIKVNAITFIGDNKLGIVNIAPEGLIFSEPCVMSIDGSSSNTGIAFLRKSDGALMATAAFSNNDGSPVRYKVNFKNEIYKILIRNKMIQYIFYEEPFVGYESAAPNLFMMRTSMEELQIEKEPQLDYIKIIEIPNKRWKKLFFGEDTSWSKADSPLQKKMVKEKMLSCMPFLAGLTQDELDAAAMGYVATLELAKGLEEELKSKKKTRPFQYNVQFIGAEDDDVMIQELFDNCTVPRAVMENGIALASLGGIGDFDKKVYEVMGNDDKLVIIKFPSNKHGNIILKHRIGALASLYDTLYAVVWRRTRK